MRYGLALVAAAILFSACGGGGAAGATPKDTFVAIQKMAEKKDFGGLYDSMSPAAMKEVEEQFEGLKKQFAQFDAEMKAQMENAIGDPTKMANAREFFMKGAEKNPDDVTEIAKAVLGDIKEEGNKATVKYKIGDRENEMKMEKVDGKWYMTRK